MKGQAQKFDQLQIVILAWRIKYEQKIELFLQKNVFRPGPGRFVGRLRGGSGR